MLICFGLGYSAQHFVEIFGRKVRPHRRHRARRRARRRVERASLGTAEGAHLRRHGGDAGIAQRHCRGRRRAGFSSAGRERRSGAARLRRCFGARATAARNRLSLDHRRLWRPRRRLGRRGNAAAAGRGAQPRAARRRASLAGFRRAPQHRGRDPAPRRHLRPRTKRAGANRERQAPAASSSRARCSTASTSATSPKPSTPPSRAGLPEFSTSPTTSRRRRPIRSSLPRSSWASSRRRKFRSSKRRRSMSPMALSFWQECRRVK